MKNYEELVKAGVDNDSDGYCAPQGMRNILLISATPYQWKHTIRSESVQTQHQRDKICDAENLGSS